MSDASDIPPVGAAPADVVSALLEQSHELLAVSDPGGRLSWANQRFQRTTGLGPGADVLSLAPGDAARSVLQRALRGELLQGSTELQLQSAAGAVLWVRIAVTQAAGQVLWSLQDTSEAHALEQRATRLAELLDVAQEFGRLGVWERDIPSGIGRWDRHVFDFWGLDPQRGTPGYDDAIAHIHPEDRSMRTYPDSTHRAGRYNQRYRVLHPDGSTHWIHSQWEVKNSAQGQPERAVGIMVDDTEVFELARSLGDTSAQLKLAVELGNIAIWRHDLITQRMHYSDRAFEVLGLAVRPEGFSIEEVRSFIHPDDLPGVMAASKQALLSDGPTDMEARYRRSDGSWRSVLTRRVVERAKDGTPRAFVGVALDVTEQVEHRRQAADSAKRLEMAAAAAGLGIFSRDTVTEEGQWNEPMFALYGRSPALGAPSQREWVEELVHPDDRAAMRRARASIVEASDGVVEHEYRIVRPDGETRWLVNRARREHWNGRAMIFGVTMDITERRRAEKALRAADERAALATRSAGIGTWEVDVELDTERWDEQMFLLRGLAPAERPLSPAERLALVHPDDQAGLLDSRRGAIATAERTGYEFRVRRPDGSTRWLASRSIPVRDERGRIVRRVGVNWDITESKDADVARQDKALAERASEAKSQFLSRMSHELRTPLNAVLGFTQLLELEADTALDTAVARSTRRDQVAHIRNAGEHLLSLINDMLDLSNLDTGNVRLETQAVPLAGLVAEALPLVQALAERHGVSLRVGPVEGSAHADRMRLRQVLLNLLTNAIKYNRTGGEVHIDAHAADDGTVRLRVRDTGRGMTATQLASLFEPFNRLGLEREGIEGTGIGLAIVKALMERMQGRVAVSSQAGQGTSFELTLESAAASGAPESSASTTAPTLARCDRSGTLLYIEDNPVNAMLVEELLHSRSGLTVRTAPDGERGVALALSLRPSLVLVDMQLPDFDGFEVLRRLRAVPETAGLTCVVLSANAMPADVARARQAGFADYWTKPINFSQFLASLETLLPVPNDK